MECVLRERLVPSVPVTVRVFNGCRLAMARGSLGLPEDGSVTGHVSFKWQTKRDPMRFEVSDEGYIRIFPAKKLYLRRKRRV